jgi:endoglycosylceramidase
MRVVQAWPLLVSLAACESSAVTPSPAESDAGAPVCTSPAFAGAPLGVRCNMLVDSQGRTVLLHGVNARVNGVFDVTFDDGRKPLEPIPPFTAADAHQIRSAGFNALRLPINWSAIEPTESGGFDERYLDKVATVVDLCRASGLYVLIDLHQDAYSKELGEDGAPLWAIAPPPSQKLGGPLTDLDARRLSKQVIDAFTTFFGATSDGLRLRERYAKMLAHVAARFAKDDAVVGFELFNEPLASDLVLPGVYGPMIAAVRAAAPAKLVFFEPSVTRNQIDRASIGAGSLGPGTVYAPHVYTLAFTGDDASRASITKDTLRPSNASAREEAEGYAAPFVVTEFGFGPSAPNFADYVRWQQELEEEQLASGSFFWLWSENSQGAWGFFDFDAAGVASPRDTVFNAMKRVRAEAIAGQLVALGYDAQARRFEARFVGGGATGPNVLSLGGALAVYDATCDGLPVLHGSLDPASLDCGGEGEHTLVLTAR